MAMTLEQQRALALARARLRAAKAKSDNLETEIQANQPQPTQDQVNQPPTELRDERGVPTGSGAPAIDQGVNDPNSVPAGQPQQYNPENLPVLIGQGVLNAGKNINSLGLAIGGTAAEVGSFGNYKPTWMEDYQKSHPLYQGQNTKENLALGLGEALPGVVAGGQAAGALEEAVAGPVSTSLRGTIGRTLNSQVGGSLGAAVTMDKDQKPLTGERIPTDPNGDPNHQEIFKTLNLAADNLFTGVAAGAVLKPAAMVGKYLVDIGKKAVDWGSVPQMKRQFVGAILDTAAQLGPNASNEEKAAAYKEINDIIKNNSKIAHEFNDPGIKDIDRSADTVTAMTSQLDPNNANDTSKKIALEGLRSSALSGGSPKLETTLRQPKADLDSTLQQIYGSRGGNDAIEQTKDALVQKGQQEVDAAKVPVGKAKDDLVVAQKGADQLVRKDPTFGPELSNAENSGIKLDLSKSSRDKQTKAVEYAQQVQGKDKEARDAAYEAIDPSIKADMKSFNKTYASIKDSLPSNVSSDIDRILEGSDKSFKYMNNVARPRISGWITDLYDQGKGTEAKALEGLRDTIIDQGNPSSIAANEANKKYTKVWNDGIGKDLLENKQINRPNTQPIDYIENGRNAVMKAIKDPNRVESVNQLREILKRTPGGDSQKLVDDIIFAEGVKGPIAKVQEKGTLSDLEVEDLVKPLRDLSANMTDVGKKRAEKFLNDFQNRKWDVAKLQEDLKGFEANAKEAESKVYEGTLKDFFQKNYKGEYDPKSNGVEILKKIYTDKYSESKLDDIISKVDPDEMKGLQAAWVHKATGDLANTKDVPILDDTFVKYGKKIFPDNPKIVDGIIKLNEEAKKISEANKIRQAQGLDTKDNQVRMATVTGQAMTMMFGVLNPTSAKIKTVTKDLLKKYDSTDKAKMAADSILADSKEFSQIADELTHNLASKLPPEAKKDFMRTLVQAGLYSNRIPDIKDRSDAKSQTDKVLKK